MLSFIRGTISQRSGVNIKNLLRHKARCKTTLSQSWTTCTSSTGFAKVDTHFTTYIKAMDPLESVNCHMTNQSDYGEVKMVNARVSLNVSLPDDYIVHDGFLERFAKDIGYNPELIMKNIDHFLVVKGKPQTNFFFRPEDISITIEVPLQTNLKINASNGADIHVNNLEGGWIYDITTDKGNCHVSSIKGTEICIKSNHGNIISKSTLLAQCGTLEVENEGKISVGKLQGSKFCLDSESGSIKTGPLYLQTGEVSSGTGSVTLGDVHGVMKVKVKEGDICVGSVTGNLSAETNKGNINVHLSQFTDVHLKAEQGDIVATIEKSQEPTKLTAKIKEMAHAADFDVSKSVEDKGENFTALEATVNSSHKEEHGSCKLKVEAKLGTFTMNYKDWFSSLKLNKQT